MQVTASQTLARNTGYVADSASGPAVLTLPDSTSLTPGDVLRIVGTGTGGWTLAQSAGQSIAFDTALPNHSNWQRGDRVDFWKALASSHDGSRVVAGARGSVFVSADFGATVTGGSVGASLMTVASSSDGSRVVAASITGDLYTSDDFGASWVTRTGAGSRAWRGVASSAYGGRLAAVASGGQIYTSADAGATWAARDSNQTWSAIASSVDGSRLVATVEGGQIYTSSNAGVSWTARDSARAWRAVASSADGSRLIAAEVFGRLYTSANGGATWTARENDRYWTAVASSADGRRLAAVVAAGSLYTSADYGATWTQRTNGARFWSSVSMSADGSRVVAGTTDSGYLFRNPAPITSSTVGTGGVEGAAGSSVELLYIGAGRFQMMHSSGTLTGR